MGRPSMSAETIRNNKISLINATMDMIHESGIQSVSARSLGARVGMNSALIYRYFRDIDELVLFACVHALQEYTNDMVVSSSELDPDNDESYDADIYMLSWEIFCNHAFNNPEEFNTLFFSRHSADLPDVIREYLELSSKPCSERLVFRTEIFFCCFLFSKDKDPRTTSFLSMT